LLRVGEKVENADGWFRSIVDRAGATAAGAPPVTSMAQGKRFWKKLSGLGDSPVKAAEIPGVTDVERGFEEMAVPPVGGKRLHPHEQLYPLNQLREQYPELKPIADLALDFSNMVTRKLTNVWELFQDEAGQFDKARLLKIGDTTRIEGKAFSHATLLQQVDKKLYVGQELRTELKRKFPGITDEQIATVDKSIRQVSEMTGTVQRMLVKANVESVASKIALVMARRGRKESLNVTPEQAWRWGNQVADYHLNYGNRTIAENMGYLTGLRNTIPEPLLEAASRIAEAQVTAHTNLVEKLTNKPWFISEVRPGQWMVAWKEKNGPRSLLGYKTKAEAERKLAELTAKQQRGELDYLKTFNKLDSAERFRGLQKDALSAYAEVDKALFDSVMAELQRDGADAETLRRVQEEFQPGDGAYRLVTPPYMLERLLAGGREELNMAEQVAMFVSAAVYGTVKRGIKQQAQVRFQSKDLLDNPALANVGQAHLSNVIEPTGKEFTKMKNFIFANYLGGNFSSMLVELTQNLTVAIPGLIEKGATFGEAYKYFRQAWSKVGKAYLKRGTRIKDSMDYGDADTNNLIDTLEHDGVIERGWLQEFSGLEDELAATKLSYIGSNAKVKNVKDLVGNSAYHLFRFVRDVYATSPRFNARVAAEAAYRFGREKLGLDHTNAIQFAKEQGRTTQFGGGRANRPTALTGLGKAQGVGGLMYALNGYTMNYLAFFARLAQRSFSKMPSVERTAARKAFATMLLTQAGLGGAMGIPLLSGVVALVEQLFPESEPRKWMREGAEKLGQTVSGGDEDLGHLIADGAMSGLFNMLVPSADVGSRFQMGSLLGVDPYQGFSWGNVVGPGAQMIEGYIKGSQKILQGEFLAGAEKLSPVGVRGLLRLVGDNGEVRDSRDRLIFSPTPGEKVLMGIGFKPKRLNQYYELQSIKMRSEQVETQRLNDLHGEVADLILQGKTAEARDRLLNEAQRTPNYDPRVGLKRAVELAQEKTIPRDPTRTGLRTTVEERSRLSRLYPQQNQPGEVERLLQRLGMEREFRIPGAGRVDRGTLREAHMIDRLMAQNPLMTRDEARQILQRARRF